MADPDDDIIILDDDTPELVESEDEDGDLQPPVTLRTGHPHTHPSVSPGRDGGGVHLVDAGEAAAHEAGAAGDGRPPDPVLTRKTVLGNNTRCSSCVLLRVPDLPDCDILRPHFYLARQSILGSDCLTRYDQSST